MKMTLLLGTIILMVNGCKADFGDGDTFTGGFSQRKSVGGSSLNSDQKTGSKVIIKGRYLFRVSLYPIADTDQTQVPTIEGLTEASKGSICVGRVFLNIKDDFSLEFPDSMAQCAFLGKMNLAELLGGLNDNADRQKAAEASGKMLRLKQLGPMTFDPPRPLLVGPIIQDPSEYQGLTETKDYKVTYKDPDKGTTTEDSGEITVNVLEAGVSMTPTFMPNSPFDNIIKFEIKTSPNGFKKIPRIKGFLFERAEFTINSRPISIPVIKLQAKASDLMAASPKNGGPAPGLANSPFAKAFAKIITLHIRLDALGFETN